LTLRLLLANKPLFDIDSTSILHNGADPAEKTPTAGIVGAYDHADPTRILLFGMESTGATSIRINPEVHLSAALDLPSPHKLI
jgi:hypothetical protein